MATRFELVLHGEDAVYLRAAGEAALAEIKRLEAQLSFYRTSSDISRINAQASASPVQVEPRLFELLTASMQLYHQTEGAFDITIGPLMRCWGFVNNTGHFPSPDVLEEARRRTGMHLVRLDASKRTISLDQPGVQIDLGGIGKGYAIDEAMASLEEDGISSALLHGGTSTIYALGHPPDDTTWKIAIPSPAHDTDDVLAVVALSNESLSLSAPNGKSFIAQGKEYGHVIDPRSGYPVEGASLTAAVAKSAMISDALSTALLVQGVQAVDHIAKTFNISTLAASPLDSSGHFQVAQQGIPLYPPISSPEREATANMEFYTHSTQ